MSDDRDLPVPFPPPPAGVTDAAPPRRLRVLTWHVHGSYLRYLTQAPHEFYLATLPGHPPGHAGRTGSLPWGANVHEVPADELARHDFDCVLYQQHRHWTEDRHSRLGPAQRALPALYLEHDPPPEQFTDTRHPAAGEAVHIVHVTPFNALMWDTGGSPATVIEYGVLVPESARYTGELAQGIVVVDHLGRDRRLGADVYEAVRACVPLKLVGMDSDQINGGVGEIDDAVLPFEMARHRFFFNPIRYANLGLPVLEAMMVGLPVVALATAELPTVIRNGVNGYVDTRVERLIEVMRMLITEPDTARQWGQAARRTALARFPVERFAADWDRLLQKAAGGAGTVVC